MPNVRNPLLRPNLHHLLAHGNTILREVMSRPHQCFSGMILISANGESNTVYLLESGWAIRSRRANDGRWQIISIFLPGDLIGSESMLLECQPDMVECLTQVQVRAIDQARLLELVEQNLAVNVRIMFEFAEDKRRLYNWGMALGQGSAGERIAAFLLDLYRRLHQAGLANHNRFWTPLKQVEIANHLGMSAEHANRVLRRLREAGIVTVKDGVVTIDGMARLSQLAAPLQDNIDDHGAPMFHRLATTD